MALHNLPLYSIHVNESVRLDRAQEMTFLHRKKDQLALARSVGLTGYTLLTIGIKTRFSTALLLLFSRFLWWL